MAALHSNHILKYSTSMPPSNLEIVMQYDAHERRTLQSKNIYLKII